MASMSGKAGGFRGNSVTRFSAGAGTSRPGSVGGELLPEMGGIYPRIPLDEAELLALTTN
ncbi:MAG: hypothetical protein LH481_02620 [Burkholderiales bacterium]|nr:hypothetical protein [Burkholderiales bacterium]